MLGSFFGIVLPFLLVFALIGYLFLAAEEERPAALLPPPPPATGGATIAPAAGDPEPRRVSQGPGVGQWRRA